MTRQTKLTQSVFLLLLVLGSAALGKPHPANGKLKIFIMSGQSNIVDF